MGALNGWLSGIIRHGILGHGMWWWAAMFRRNLCSRVVRLGRHANFRGHLASPSQVGQCIVWVHMPKSALGGHLRNAAHPHHVPAIVSIVCKIVLWRADPFMQSALFQQATAAGVALVCVRQVWGRLMNDIVHQPFISSWATRRACWHNWASRW